MTRTHIEQEHDGTDEHDGDDEQRDPPSSAGEIFGGIDDLGGGMSRRCGYAGRQVSGIARVLPLGRERRVERIELGP